MRLPAQQLMPLLVRLLKYGLLVQELWARLVLFVPILTSPVQMKNMGLNGLLSLKVITKFMAILTNL